MDIDLSQKKINEIQYIAKTCDEFGEFWENAEGLIWEHYKELHAQEQVFEDDVKSYARELWDDFDMPF